MSFLYQAFLSLQREVSSRFSDGSALHLFYRSRRMSTTRDLLMLFYLQSTKPASENQRNDTIGDSQQRAGGCSSVVVAHLTHRSWGSVPRTLGRGNTTFLWKLFFSTYQFLSIVLSAFHTLFNFIPKITCETNIYIPGFPLLSKLVFPWPVHLICLLLTNWIRILYWDYARKGLFVVVLNLYWITNS